MPSAASFSQLSCSFPHALESESHLSSQLAGGGCSAHLSPLPPFTWEKQVESKVGSPAAQEPSQASLGRDPHVQKSPPCKGHLHLSHSSCSSQQNGVQGQTF